MRPRRLIASVVTIILSTATSLVAAMSLTTATKTASAPIPTLLRGQAGTTIHLSNEWPYRITSMVHR